MAEAEINTLSEAVAYRDKLNSRHRLNRAMFQNYLERGPKCIFMRNLHGSTETMFMDWVIKRWMKAIRQGKSEPRITVFDILVRMKFDLSKCGVLALFPQYMVFFSKGEGMLMSAMKGPTAAATLAALVGMEGLIDLYELGDMGVNLVTNAVGLTSRERKLKIKNTDEWLEHSCSFVLPISSIKTLEKDGSAALSIEDVAGYNYSLSQPMTTIYPWRYQLLRAYKRIKEGRI